MHLFVSADAAEQLLLGELSRAWPAERHSILGPRLLSTDAPIAAPRPPFLTFVRQWLPEAVGAEAASISTWSDRLIEALHAAGLGDQPWLLHVEPQYGEGAASAGRNRCDLILENLRATLRRKQRRLLRTWRAEPETFSPAHSLMQLLLTAPDRGWLSIAAAPIPHRFRALLSPFPKGEVPVASDKAAPSRAFAKLIEAELRLGRRIGPGHSCVDLGASPGSWTYVALQRGARVTAVDRAPLRDELMRHPRLTFRQGDAFKYVPVAADDSAGRAGGGIVAGAGGTGAGAGRGEVPRVDWMLCDVIAAPERSIDLLLDWVRRRWARQFVVTIKFKGEEDYAVLDRLKETLPALCSEFFLTRLCANKNEACAFGVVE